MFNDTSRRQVGGVQHLRQLRLIVPYGFAPVDPTLPTSTATQMRRSGGSREGTGRVLCVRVLARRSSDLSAAIGMEFLG